MFGFGKKKKAPEPMTHHGWGPERDLRFGDFVLRTGHCTPAMLDGSGFTVDYENITQVEGVPIATCCVYYDDLLVADLGFDRDHTLTPQELRNMVIREVVVLDETKVTETK